MDETSGGGTVVAPNGSRGSSMPRTCTACYSPHTADAASSEQRRRASEKALSKRTNRFLHSRSKPNQTKLWLSLLVESMELQGWSEMILMCIYYLFLFIPFSLCLDWSSCRCVCFPSVPIAAQSPSGRFAQPPVALCHSLHGSVCMRPDTRACVHCQDQMEGDGMG